MNQVLSKSLRATDQDINDYLMHYGVKGMRWGVRKDRNSIGKKSNKSKSKSTDSNKTNTKSKDKSSSSTTKNRSLSKLTEDEMLTRINNLTSKENDALNKSKMVLEAAKTVKGDTLDGPLKTVLEFHPKGLEVANQAADNLGLGSNTTKSTQQLEWDRWVSLTPEQRFSEMSRSQKRMVREREERIKAYRKSLNHDDLIDDLIEDSLMHYGVKGMKWGVRKDLKKKKNVYERSEYIAKKDAKWRSNVSNPKKAIRVAKRASREATRMTKELNAKYKKQGYKIGGNSMRKNNLDNRRNKLARSQYDTELKGILEYSLDKAALKVYKNSPTRLYQVNLSRSSDGTIKAKVAPRQNAKLDKQRAAITKRNMKLKHSDENDDVVDLNGLEFELTQDSDGFVTSVGVPGDDLEHDEMNDIDDYLMHYGVKGMKWGVRKDGKPQGYQGGGGSSKSKKKKKSDTVNRVKSNLRKTAGNAKKKVSKISEANKDRKEARAKAKAAAKPKPKPKAKRELDVDKAQSEARAIEAERKSNPTLHSPDTTKTILTNSSRTGAMTDAELKATIQRMHLENTYAKLVREATPKSTSQKLKEFAKATATDIAKQQVKRVAGDFVGNLVDQAVSGGVKDAKDQKKKNDSKPKDDTPKSDSKPKSDTRSNSDSGSNSDSKPKPAPTWRPTPPGPGRPPNKPPAPTWRPTPPEKPLSGAPIFGDRGRNYKGTRRARDVIDNNASVTVAELMERRRRRQR